MSTPLSKRCDTCGEPMVCVVDSRPYTSTTWKACAKHAEEAFRQGHDCDGWEPLPSEEE